MDGLISILLTVPLKLASVETLINLIIGMD
jgi:hypothetical protein